ncbi:hypothetical protein FF011L_14340 [Roseimaritima multifibrata]|uniref:Uncharacterized protein n=1 Tax=Roseimaritima multifibrata TaxID=1930274 RepID=A0A517MCY3_9BACT|nr:hypothetical protein FF011L_14340 [Roseimaritima multifibrata]
MSPADNLPKKHANLRSTQTLHVPFPGTCNFFVAARSAKERPFKSPFAGDVKSKNEGFAAVDESYMGPSEQVARRPADTCRRREPPEYGSQKESPAGDRTNLVCRPLGLTAHARFPLTYANGKYLPPAGLKALHSDSDGQGLIRHR